MIMKRSELRQAGGNKGDTEILGGRMTGLDK